MEALSHADRVLLGVALPMVLAAVAALASPVSWASALAAGSLPASGTVGYALFVDPPAN